MTSRRPRQLSAPPTLRLREPADVLSAIPYLIGYHPDDSVVVLALRGTRLAFCARDDLPAAATPDSDVRGQAERLTRSVRAQSVTAVVLVGYGADERVRPLLFALRDEFDRAKVAVRELLRAAHGRHWSYLCADPDCCPPEGTAYDTSTSPAAAAATLIGRVALADRAAYERQIEPVEGVHRVAMRQATVRADERLLSLLGGADGEAAAMDAVELAGRQAIDAALARQRAGERLEDDEVAWLTVLLASIPVRDLAWVQITGEPEALEQHRALWMDVLRRVEPDLVMAPGSLFAFASWLCGETILARLALERVLDQDPCYTMAIMIDNCLARGTPPSVLDGWPGMSPDDLSWRSLRRRLERLRRRRSSSRRARSRRG